MSADSGMSNVEMETTRTHPYSEHSEGVIFGKGLKKKRGRPKLTEKEKADRLRLGKTSSIEVSKLKKVKRKYTKKAVAIEPQPTRPVHLDNSIGTISTETHSRFTVKEIVDIINASHGSNLSVFRYMGLVLSFHGQVATPDQPKTFSETPGRKTQEKSSGPDQPLIQGWNDKEAKRSEEMASLMVNDPQAYEQAMIDSMAENATGEREIS